MGVTGANGQPVATRLHLERKVRRVGAWRDALGRNSVYMIFLLLVIVSAQVSPAFLTWTNIANLLRQASYIGLVATGMTFVILSGGIDLSVGATVAVSGVLLAYLFHWGGYKGYVVTLSPAMPDPLIVLTALASGAVVGLVNGFLIAKAQIPAFVATLATMVSIRGVAYMLAGGRTIFGLGESLSVFGFGNLGRLPVPVAIWIACLLVSAFVLKRTVFGRWVYAVGGDEDSARLSGINCDRHKILVYVIAGAFAALAGILMACRIDQGEPRQGELFELDAIAAVVIGGTSLSGGRGGVTGTAVGVLILTLITNVLNLVGVHPFPQRIVKGIIILGGVFLQRWLASRS